MARYIDADEALRVMRNVKSDKPSYGDWELACDCCIGMVEVVPTADVVEVKHGEWVKNGKTRTCSCCGYFYINVDMEDDNYCPNCGAKMDGGAK